MIRSHDFVVSLNDVENDDIAYAGERAASIGGMSHNGFPIIPGFVVTSNAYELFLQEGNLKKKINHLLGSINFDNQASILQVSSHIQKLIQKSKVPRELSDQIFSFYESVGKNSYVLIQQSNMQCFLNERYCKTAEIFKGDAVVMDALRKIWSYCYIPSALIERYKNGFIEACENCSVVITNVLDVLASGSSKTLDKENVFITAGFGYLETGFDYDTYTVLKNKGGIVEKKIVRQEEMHIYKKGVFVKSKVETKYSQNQKISDGLILYLATLTEKAEKKYYFPQVIEWVCVKDEDPRVNTRDIFSTLHGGVESAEAEISSHSSASLRSRFSAKVDKIYVKARYEYTPYVEENFSESKDIIAVFPGIGIGKIVYVNNPADFFQIKRGHIVVTSLSIDNYLPEVKRASGLILKKYNDRLASVIRVKNLGVPTVAIGIDAQNQFYLGKDTIVTLDGTTGSILTGSILV